MTTTAGPGGGAALGGGASVAPPPIFSPVEPAATTDSGEHSELPVDAGYWPATRQRVVLLPHARTEPANTRPDNRRVGRGIGMNQDESPRQHWIQSNGTTRAIPASTQWHDAELAMKVARHSFDRWLTAGHADTPSLAMMHAYHTHTALHEAARVITMLIETFRVEAAALITTPARGTDIPTQHR